MAKTKYIISTFSRLNIFANFNIPTLVLPAEPLSKERWIIYPTFHVICLLLPLLLIGITINYSAKIVN